MVTSVEVHIGTLHKLFLLHQKFHRGGSNTEIKFCPEEYTLAFVQDYNFADEVRQGKRQLFQKIGLGSKVQWFRLN